MHVLFIFSDLIAVQIQIPLVVLHLLDAAQNNPTGGASSIAQGHALCLEK